MNNNDGLDARLQQLYHQLPTQEPSSSIDQAILNAAKVKKMWHQPFAVAATVVMATSLVWYWQAQQPQQLQQAMSLEKPDAPLAMYQKNQSVENSASAPQVFEERDPDMPLSPVTQQEKSPINDVPPQAAKKSQATQSIMSDNLTTLKEDNSVAAAPEPVLEVMAKTKAEDVNQVMAQGALGASQAQEKDNAQYQLAEKRQANTIMAKQALMRDAQTRVDEAKLERAESKSIATRLQDVQRVFEQHHVALKKVYLQELKNNTNTTANIHFKLAITATGKVTLCEVISSDLNNAKLDTQIVALIKDFDFGEGEAWQGEYKLHL